MQVTSSKNDARKYWRSSSFKMALLFTILLGMSVGVLGYFSYYFNRGHYIDSAHAMIDTEIRYLLAADAQKHLIPVLASASLQKDRVYILATKAGGYVAGNLKSIPLEITTLTEGTILFQHENQNFAAKIHILADGRLLLVGVNISDSLHSYRMMQWLSLASILLMLVVIAVSFLISMFVVRKTNNIAATAKSIMETGDLSKRITIDANWDDLSNMAYVLNTFLGRVEELMQGIRHVSDNIAHDLRTPLTRLLNNLETMQSRQSTLPLAELQVMIDSMIGETQHLLDTFHALLRITGIQTRKQRQNFTLVDLQLITHDVVELYEPLAEEKSITIVCHSQPLETYGDRDLLFQALANILDNSIKFTPAGGAITINMWQDAIRSYVSISDTGPGIAESDREKVFDRFYRTDTSRAGSGTGLGLSLVAAILDLHKSVITLKDASPGVIFEIAFLPYH